MHGDWNESDLWLAPVYVVENQVLDLHFQNTLVPDIRRSRACTS